MDWIKVSIFTTSEGIEPLSGRLYQLGITGLEIEDEKDFNDFLENNKQYWDYVDDELIKEKEGERILKSIKDDSYVIALAIEGKMRSSEELAARIEKLGIGGESHLTFVIGGSLGLAPAVLNRADEKLSFSPMTFPHQLMRVILLEQIYRSYRIINHEPYHK